MPISLAIFTAWAVSWTDRMMIGRFGCSFRIRRATSKPLSSGMVMSRINSPGFSLRVCATASKPFRASPQTTYPLMGFQDTSDARADDVVVVCNQDAHELGPLSLELALDGAGEQRRSSH